MNEECEIQLQTESILNVPLLIYGEFTFTVNGKEFKTSRLISDLLSPKISQIHKSDPTFNKYEIKTNYEGDFSYILNLVGFNQISIPNKEIPFICEVIEILGNQSIKIKDSKNVITNDNVFALIHSHEQYSFFFAKSLDEEIDYISEHFYEIFENQEKELKELSEPILKRILANPKLRVIDEDQVLTFVNQLYMSDSKYSALYEYVSFENVEGESMDQFLAIFNINNLTIGIWKSLSKRLSQRNKNTKKQTIDQQRHPHFSVEQTHHIHQQKQQQNSSMPMNQHLQYPSPQPHQQIQDPSTHTQPKYPPMQPHQLQQLQQQLLQQQEEKQRQKEEDQLREQQLELLKQRMLQQRQEQHQQLQQQEENLNENQNQENTNQDQQTQETNDNQNSRNNHESKLFSYDSNNQFSGILDYLNKESRGNIDDIINITASSISGRSFPSNVTLLLDRNRRFCSSGVEQNPWICFDFRDYQIIPSNYTLRSCDSGYDPKSWVIEGSKDNSNWEVLDAQNNCTLLKGDFKTHTFSIQNSKPEQYRYLRMRMTDANWMNDYSLIINSFELYGALI